MKLSQDKPEAIDFILGMHGGLVVWLFVKAILEELFSNLILPVWVQYLIPIMLSPMMGYLCLKNRSVFLILSTCLLGSYQIGIVLMSKQLFVIKWQFIMFLSLVVIITAVSFFFQY